MPDCTALAMAADRLRSENPLRAERCDRTSWAGRLRTRTAKHTGMSALPPPRSPAFPPVREAVPLSATSIRASWEEPALEILRRAEAMKIPWQRLLRDEIRAEQTLSRHGVDSDAEMPLATAVSLLPSAFLKSWRVRDQIQSLSCEARGASFRKAVGDLRMIFRHLIGPPLARVSARAFAAARVPGCAEKCRNDRGAAGVRVFEDPLFLRRRGVGRVP